MLITDCTAQQNIYYSVWNPLHLVTGDVEHILVDLIQYTYNVVCVHMIECGGRGVSCRWRLAQLVEWLNTAIQLSSLRCWVQLRSDAGARESVEISCKE